MGKPKDRSPKVKPSRFIAMLRGINVSGHKIIKMESLRRCFEGMGFHDVVTYVQSGNVIFEADGKSVANLSDQIGKRILRDFGFSVPVLLKTSTEIERIVHDNPFVNQ